jgi:hypothetical protein
VTALKKRETPKSGPKRGLDGSRGAGCRRLTLRSRSMTAPPAPSSAVLAAAEGTKGQAYRPAVGAAHALGRYCAGGLGPRHAKNTTTTDGARGSSCRRSTRSPPARPRRAPLSGCGWPRGLGRTPAPAVGALDPERDRPWGGKAHLSEPRARLGLGTLYLCKRQITHFSPGQRSSPPWVLF